MSSFKYSDVYRIVYPRRHEGIYKNRGDNPWVSIRIRQGVGRDPSKWFSNQLRVIAEVSKVYGDGRAMLGTRGDIEIFKVDFRLFDEVVAKLKEVGLDPRDSCGNSVRNPIPCTSQFCPYAHINAEALSTFIGDYFRYRSEYEQPSLPHRIKISISACERACAVPVAQDIGIVAKPNGKFDVYLGGGIGEHAFSAKLAFTDVDAEDLLPICVGVAEVFRRSGERRGFKWVVKLRGLDKVKEEVMAIAREIKPKLPKPPDLTPRFIKSRIVKVPYPTGWVTADELIKLADVAERYGFGYVLLFNNQSVYIPIREGVNKIEELNNYEIRDPGPIYPEGPITVACLGNELCPPGLIDTTGLGRKIHVHLSRLNEPIRVGISGCTHDCGMSWVSDIGFEPFGSKTRILITMGGSPTALGFVIGTVDPGDAELAAQVLLEMYRESGVRGVRDFVTKVGVDTIRSELVKRAPSFKPPDKDISIVFGPD
ncbi:nitrite and sulphite reductase 4Fe-4S region [Vulcanisaeta distributa DSM 14429]|uniref:Nitrite and sulphite reductase 4Fe-4S region n=1 Tax=Vulcanisaeta distributa (strain DSM 14429 / JCM 11212 / NBRC 100878 / IC-017) TaxID=572478 RepID=E1QSV5_VULDI|nr:nitrite reductase [Vulcanisaeta distributa]ADN50822.1 nitrite and sulphite reductase 4Fe-4S region [Vulcanisaeta distributa DSM 14429]